MEQALEIEAQLAERQADEELAHVARVAAMEGPDGYRIATEALKQLAGKSRNLLERRKALTAPLDESKKRILALFKPAQDRLDKAIAVLRNAISKHDMTERQRLERATEEAARLMRAGDTEGAIAAAMEASHIDEAASGISKRSIWHFRVTDAGAIPDEYWTLDEKRIGGVVRALKADTKIPGIEVYEETIAVIRGGEDENV